LPVPDTVESRIANRQEFLEYLLRHEPLPIDSNSIIAAVARTHAPIWVPEALADARIPVFHETGLRCRSYVAVPLAYRDEQLGVMALTTGMGGSVLDESDFEIIKSIADQAAFALHSAQMFSQLADKKRLDHDLAVAQEIQRILLPSEAPELEEYQFSAINLPAAQVSGDYYDYIPVDDTRWGLAIADVSGKGVPASLIMAMCRSVLRSKAFGSTSPAQVLREVNRLLHPDIKEDMFITMVYVILDTATGEIRLARAGHELPLLCRRGSDLIETVQSPGMALGIDGGEIFDSSIQDVTLRLEPFDSLILYTDGINEAMDEEGQEFGKENLKEALKTCGHLSAANLISGVIERVRRFSSGHKQNDDITMAALQRRPK
jgi:phosphoserine phosphatase RsbU/P